MNWHRTLSRNNADYLTKYYLSSIDCNVPLPNSFNLEDYRKQMVCSCCPSVNGAGYFEGLCLPQPATVSSSPIQTPACSFQCQCCPFEPASSPGFDPLPMQPTTAPTSGPCPLPSLLARTSRPEQAVTVTPKAPGSAVAPQIFYLAAPASPMPEAEGSCYPPDQLPAYLYSMIPAQSMSPVWNVQAINLVPVGVPVPQPQHLPQQQLVANPAQNSQLPTQQLVRYDLPFPRLLAELRRERDRSCCEYPTPVPLAFQLYAPAHTVTFCDPPTTVASPSVPKRDVLAATASPDPMSVPSASQSPATPPPSPDPAGPARARSDSPKRSRSCLRNKELWDSSGAAQSRDPSYPSAAQHGAGNVCMKCGNCWHCPRCSCSNCFWHPGLVRAPPRDSR